MGDALTIELGSALSKWTVSLCFLNDLFRPTFAMILGQHLTAGVSGARRCWLKR